MTNAAIERRQGTDIAEAIFVTGNLEQMVETAAQNTDRAIAIARQQGFVTDYPVKKKINGRYEVVGTKPWYHLDLWRLLAKSLGLVAFTEGIPVEVKPGTWMAAAVCQAFETEKPAGRAVAACAKSEPGKQDKPDHDLMATAQSRAQRNAIRSAIGELLIAAKPELADLFYNSEAPATARQKGRLHELERALGWTHDYGHERASVSSYSNLTGDQAHELIDEWQQLLADVKADVGETAASGSAATHGEPERSPSEQSDESARPAGSSEQGTPEEKTTLAYGEGAATPTSGAPDLDELWHQAIAAGLTTKKAVPFAKANGITVNAAYELDAEQMTVLLAKWRERKG